MAARTLERQRRYRDYTSEDVLAQTELLGKVDTHGLAMKFYFQPSLVNSTINKTSFVVITALLTKHN
jgi:iron complex outermembrane receptor protein